MTRGLKGERENNGNGISIDVTLIDPMTRGLKESQTYQADTFRKVVTLIDPMTRGLKAGDKPKDIRKMQTCYTD